MTSTTILIHYLLYRKGEGELDEMRTISASKTFHNATSLYLAIKFYCLKCTPYKMHVMGSM